MSTLRPEELALGFDVVPFLTASEQADLSTCDREPIHLSGAIQPYGLLLTLHAADLTIAQVSANCEQYLAAPPAQLLGAPLAAALGSELADRVSAAMRDPEGTGLDPVVCHLPSGLACDLTWHRSNAMVVLEIEPVEPANASIMPVLFADLRHAVDLMQDTDTVAQLCAAAATEVKRITGYDRVMVYRFHPDGHGEVVAEEREPALESFLGLHYPTTDIPRQALKLYLLNHLRVIVDVDYQPVPILGAAGTDPHALDLSRASLRSVSPVHLAYLRNMGVQATLTISLMKGTRLWGMLACHHDTAKRLDAQLRAACRMLGQVFSLQVVAHELAEQSAHRAELAECGAKLAARLAGADAIALALTDGDPSPLLLTGADAMVARIDGQVVALGAVPPHTVVDALLARLRSAEVPDVVVTEHLGALFPQFAADAERAAGVLAVPLSAAYEDFIVWFRGEFRHTQIWAGNPAKAMLPAVTGSAPGAPLPGGAAPTGSAPAEPAQGAPGTADGAPPADNPNFAVLSPRDSFAAWAEEVRGQSRPWLATEVEAATALAATIPELLLGRARNRLAYRSLHDELTGLPNRVLLLDRLTSALSRQRRGGIPLALLHVDLDGFAAFNQDVGWAAGDALLRQAGERLVGVSAGALEVSRLGGDQFAVLAEGLSAAEVEQLADRVLAAFRLPFQAAGQPRVMTVSVGAVLAVDDDNAAGLLRDAESAMNLAKRNGRNTVAPFTYAMRTIALRREEIGAHLRRALDRAELELHYQPVHRLDGTLVAFEALTRWSLSDRGMVPPADLFAVAQERDLSELTAFAVRDGLACLAGWRRQHPGLQLGLNFTAGQLADPTLPTLLAATLAEHDLPGQALSCEVSEAVLAAFERDTRLFLAAVQPLGVGLTVDNFGTGFSSLAALRNLPITTIKIDHSFVAGLPDHDQDVTMVASVVGLGRRLQVEVTAVGVENDQQLAAVRRLGCETFQGYYAGPPMPAAEVQRYLAARSRSTHRPEEAAPRSVDHERRRDRPDPEHAAVEPPVGGGPTAVAG